MFFKLCPSFRLPTKLYMPKNALRLTALNKSSGIEGPFGINRINLPMIEI